MKIYTYISNCEYRSDEYDNLGLGANSLCARVGVGRGVGNNYLLAENY